MKYRDWLDEWLDSYIKPTVKAQTLERYTQTIKAHITPELGDCEIEELSPIILQRYINKLLFFGNTKTDKGVSSNFVNEVISRIKSLLKTAVTLGLKKVYNMDKLRRPKQEGKKIECFTASEQKKIENAVTGSKKSKLCDIVLCLYTGLRIGELLALTWSDIDFNKGLLTVSKTCHDGNREGEQVGNTDFYIDLLFYNRALSCLVEIELKVGKFKPEHLGQLNFYLEALDRDVKKENENPRVGFILCTLKDDTVVEYAMSRSLSPTMVACYTLKLPDKKLLTAKLREITELITADVDG